MFTYILVVLITFAGGLISGMAGFGALIIMVPALLFVFGMDIIIPLSVLCGIATQGANAVSFRSHIEKKFLLPVLLGSIPGVWAGISLLIHLPENYLRIAMGVMIIAYVLWSVFGKLSPPTNQPAQIWAYVDGFFSGSFCGAFAMNGPPAVIYATRTNWEQDRIRAFLGAFCTILFVITAAVMIMRGLFSAEVWQFSAWAIPACIVGNYFGQKLTEGLDRQ
jgi:uncharacterized membrane protein YfcA